MTRQFTVASKRPIFLFAARERMNDDRFAGLLLGYADARNQAERRTYLPSEEIGCVTIVIVRRQRSMKFAVGIDRQHCTAKFRAIRSVPAHDGIERLQSLAHFFRRFKIPQTE